MRIFCTAFAVLVLAVLIWYSPIYICFKYHGNGNSCYNNIVAGLNPTYIQQAWHLEYDQPAWKGVTKAIYGLYMTNYLSGSSVETGIMNFGLHQDWDGLNISHQGRQCLGPPSFDTGGKCMYLHTAGNITGDILEIGSGRGGGAHFLSSCLCPKSYTGLELLDVQVNDANAKYARVNHQCALRFVGGSALELPFDNESFDTVLNIESSHLYPSFTKFVTEVRRILRPGGAFYIADVRNSYEIPLAMAALERNFESVEWHDITEGFLQVHKHLPPIQQTIDNFWELGLQFPFLNYWPGHPFRTALQKRETFYVKFAAHAPKLA